MPTKQGQVYKVFAKDLPGKFGKPGVRWYSIKLEGDDNYYRCKANNPGELAGLVVSFEVDAENNVTSKPTVVEHQAANPASKAAPAAVASGAVLGTAREASIHYQSARKDALQFVDILTKTGAIKLPAKEAAKLEALEALVDSYTSQYFSDISTFGAVARAKGETEEAATEAATADDEE